MVYCPDMSKRYANRSLLGFPVLICVFLLIGLLGATYQSFKLEQEVQALTVQNVECDGLSLSIRSDATQARDFLTRACSSWSVDPDRYQVANLDQR